MNISHFLALSSGTLILTLDEFISIHYERFDFIDCKFTFYLKIIFANSFSIFTFFADSGFVFTYK